MGFDVLCLGCDHWVDGGRLRKDLVRNKEKTGLMRSFL